MTADAQSPPDRGDRIEAVARVLAASFKAAVVRQPGDQIHVSRFHRDVATAVVDALALDEGRGE